MSDRHLSQVHTLNDELKRRIAAVRAGRLDALPRKQWAEVVLAHLVISQKALDEVIEFHAGLERARGQVQRSEELLEERFEEVPPL